MNIQTKVANLKRGDVIWVRSTDLRHKSYTSTVKAIGPKYITIDSGIKFERDTLGRVDWGCWYLYPGTEADYNASVIEESKCRRLRNEAQDLMLKMELGELENIVSYIKSKEK